MRTASPQLSRLPHLLACAGALPFVAAGLLSVAGTTSVPGIGPVQDATALYGLLITVFLAGIHWGQQLSDVKPGVNLFAVSNVIVVVLFVSWLLLPMAAVILLLVVALGAILVIDATLLRDGVLSPVYFRTRFIITGIAMLSLGLVVALP
jgi:hypothetical protein